MADFDFSTLITDRGQSDLATLRSVLSTPMEEWTAEQLAAFNLAASKGAYNYTDLNRVTACMDNLNERLTALGYQTGYERVQVPHQGGGGSVLPEGYTQLEYIQSSGSQYINTGLSMPEGFRAVLDFQFTQASQQIQCLIGSHEQAAPYYRNYFGINANFQSWNLGCYDSYSFGTLANNTRYKVDVCNVSQKIKCVINEENQNLSQSIATNAARSSRPLYLFAMNYPDGLLPAYMRLYSCKIYSPTGELVRDFVPCTNPSGVVGLYDLANGAFYANAGTGVFAAGPEIPPEPEPEPLDPYTWYESDVPTESTMEGYLANVAALRGVLPLPENTAEVPADMAGLTLAEANAIEEILLVIEDYLTALASVFRRCGAAICGGPGFYFVN